MSTDLKHFDKMADCCRKNRESNCSVEESCARCMMLKKFISDDEAKEITTNDVRKFLEDELNIASDPAKMPLIELETKGFKKRFVNIDDEQILAFYKMKHKAVITKDNLNV